MLNSLILRFKKKILAPDWAKGKGRKMAPKQCFEKAEQ